MGDDGPGAYARGAAGGPQPPSERKRAARGVAAGREPRERCDLRRRRWSYLILGHYSVRAWRWIVKNGRKVPPESGRFNAIVYSYPGGEHDMIITSGLIEVGTERPPDMKPAARVTGKKAEGQDMERSMRRARAKLRRLALANDFEYFVTLTLDPARIDRYDGAAVVKALGRWADNMVRRHGLRYILVPELHKDGAIHFHGFLAGNGLKAVDSGVAWDGRPVYNLPQWTLGFSTAQRLYGDYHAAVGYCCKYIGKQDGDRPLGRWYYSGGALQEPTKEYIEVDYTGLVDNLLTMGPLREGERFPAAPVQTRIGAIWVQNNIQNLQKGVQNDD